MEVPRLGVESELQLLAYTTATATSELFLNEKEKNTHIDRLRVIIIYVKSWLLERHLKLASYSDPAPEK